MALTFQDGRTVTLTDGMIGLIAGLDADVVTVSTIPTLGNLMKDGIEMAVNDTILLSEVRAGSLTFLSVGGNLGSSTFGFNSDAIIIEYSVVIGVIGKLYILAKTTAPVLSINDNIPREIPALLANKLAHEVAARILERGDRQSDDAMAQRARARFYEAKLDTIASINTFGGAFNTIEAI